MGAEKRVKIIKWAKRLGFWGFMFFLLKGLAWLTLGYFVFK